MPAFRKEAKKSDIVFDVVKTGSHDIALMDLGVLLPRGYNWKLSDVKVKNAPAHGGEVAKAWQTLGAISTANGLAEAYQMAGGDGVVYSWMAGAVQDLTHTSNSEAVDVFMADPVVTFGGKTAMMLLKDPAASDFSLESR